MGAEAPLRVLVAGGRGLIGRALLPALRAEGHSVAVLTRRPAGPDDLPWDPARGALEARALEGFDAVVNLAGENIGTRWSAARKARIRASRVDSTALLATALARLERRPRVLVSMSAVGWYGDRGEETLDETSAPGSGFLAGVCRAWEAAAAPAAAAGIRVAHPRAGQVLAASGGTLKAMLPVFRLGLGGRLGSGRAWWPWIAVDDLVGVIRRLIADASLSGPVNAVAPGLVRNAEFTRVLARVLRRPAVLPVPAFALRMVFDGMADALPLASARVAPARLAAAGCTFRFPELEGALRHALGAPS